MSLLPVGKAYNYAFGQLNKGEPRKATTSAYGQPIAIVYGTRRISGNLIFAGWYMKNWVTGMFATFTNSMVMVAICEGPISEVLAVWKGRTRNTPAGYGIDIIQTGAGITAYSAAVTYAKGAWVSSGGTNYASLQGTNLNHTPASSPTWWSARGSATTERAQSPWSYMTTNHPLYALGYGGVALCNESTTWASMADGELERASFEVSGFYTTATGSPQSVHPATIVADLLTNAEYGLGWDTARIDGYSTVPGYPIAFTAGVDGTAETSYYNLCISGDLKLALALEEQRPAREIIEEIAIATDSVWIWSGGQLKMRPLATWYGTTGATFDGGSAVVPVYELGLSQQGADFLAEPGEEMIQVEREALKEHFNSFPIEWTNRSPVRVDSAGTVIVEPFNAYNPDVEEGTPNPNDVALYGVRKAPLLKLPCIVSREHAAYVANALASRSITGRNTYRFRLGWRFARLEPCDVVTITDAELGLDRKLVRILELEEGEDGAFDLVAEEVGTTPVADYVPFTVELSDSTAYGVCVDAPCTAISATVTATATGGSGVYTLAWSRVSGTAMTVSHLGGGAVRFVKTTLTGVITAVYRCTATDTITGQTDTADVAVELEGSV